MALPSGLGSTLAIAEETVYGTPVTAGARGYEFDSNSLMWNKTTAQGTGLRGTGLVARAARRVVTSVTAEGEIEMDFATRGMGLWLKHALGGFAIAQVGATPAFKQTFTLGDLRGRNLTIQAGLPDSTGALQPYTYVGSKITEWGIAVGNQELAKFSASVVSRDCLVDQAYVTPDMTQATAAGVLSFAGASLYVAGSATPVLGNIEFGIQSNSSLNTERYFTGRNGRKDEPLNAGWVEPVVTVEQEYADQLTWVARNFTDETFSVKMEFLGAVISGAERERLTVTCAAVKINGENPTVDGPEQLQHSLELPVLDNGVDSPVVIEYVSRDTAA